MARTSLIVLTALAALAPGIASAQPSSLPLTGTELALEGQTRVRAGRSARFRGTAYQVRGLSSLEAFEGPVRARIARVGEDDEGASWRSVRADSAGHFVIDVPIPREALVAPRVVRFSVGADARVFDFALQVRGGSRLWLRADRVLYEPGEPVHIFGLLRHPETGAPIANAPLTLHVEGDPIADFERELTTSSAGVVHTTFELADDTPLGPLRFTLEGADGTREVARSQVGQRVRERIFATLELPETPTAPGALVTARVRVTTPSGAPVRGARASLQVDSQPGGVGTTDDDGRAEIELSAPAYHVHSTGRVTVSAQVEHPAHGRTTASEMLHLAVPLALTVEVIAPHAGLLPEVDDRLFVRVRDGVGDPPPEGTVVTVEGAAVRGGRVDARTDAHGLVEVPARLPLGGWRASLEAVAGQSSLRVEVAGPLARETHTDVPVLPFATVAPRLDRVLASPGEPVRVELLRAPGARARGAVVELLDAAGHLLVAEWASANARSVQITLPADRLGLFRVRVRPLERDESEEGTGASAALIVRPPTVDFARVTPTQPRWGVGETARVEVRTAPGAPRSWFALSVRDLASHGGEQPFEQRFLANAFDRAILEESDDGARLVRAALAAHVQADARAHARPPLLDDLGLAHSRHSPTQPRAMRDPWPLARELERRGVARAMRLAEARLSEALEGGDLSTVSVGAGASRRFREDLFEDDSTLVTLGGQPLRPSMLSAADPSFTYASVGRRVARRSLVQLLGALARYLDPGDGATPAERMAAREPSSRWLSRMVQRGAIAANQLRDPFGGRFELRAARSPALVVAAPAASLELVSAGPDGRFGTSDDVRDPFARVVPTGTPFAIASGEDRLARRIATTDISARTLDALSDAYARTSAEMAEDEIGDAVTGEVGEGTIGLGNLGTIGHGGGGGTGSGYGRGAGGFRGRRSRVPRVRAGSASVNLASIVRERFPPTLLFEPEHEVDASGTTAVDVPLSQAVTTYLVEAIVWREDGWVSSAHTRLEVEREVVVSAPIPELVRRGDRVRLPLRVSNRGARTRELLVGMRGDPSLGIPDVDPTRVTLAPGDGEVVEVEIDALTLGRGALTAVVLDASGEPVDAVRRAIEVVEPARRRTRRVEGLADGRGSLELVVPDDATARAATVVLTHGRSLFEPNSLSDVYAPWAAGDHDAEVPLMSGELADQSRAIAVMAPILAERGEGAQLTRAVVALTRALERAMTNADPERAALTRADVLLGLSQAPPEASPAELQALMVRLRREVAEGAVALDDAPAAWAISAAGLAAAGGERDRARELLRRLERHAVRVGDDRWVVAETGAVRATLHAALAEVLVGERARAFEWLASVARWHHAGHRLTPDELSLGRFVVTRLRRGAPPETATVTVDGESHEVSLEGGSGELPLRALAEPGTHTVVVRTRGVLFVELEARYGVPWARAPRERGPLTVELERTTPPAPRRDGDATFTLSLRNRSARTLRRAFVEIELPTGLERVRVTSGRRRRSQLGGGILRVELQPLSPGARRELQIEARWSVAGSVVGLGVSAADEARPEAITVLQPTRVDVATEAP